MMLKRENSGVGGGPIIWTLWRREIFLAHVRNSTPSISLAD
jgi:hypothetical protein